MYYFVYVKDLIGVETNVDSFCWNLGSFAPNTTQQEYANCLIKIKINVCSDTDVLTEIKESNLNRRFRHFYVNDSKIAFIQKLKFITLGYRMSIDGNSIDIMIGKNYMHYVKYKIMNVHPIGYVLYDAVSCLLLKNGLTILYGSAVETGDGEATVFMGAPGVGKTSMAINLCKEKQVKMLSEDLVVTDGQRVWGVPYTSTYRGNCNKNEVLFSEGCASVKSLVILEQCDSNAITSSEMLLKKVYLLNRYGVQYYSSPTMMAYEYFQTEFSLDSFFKIEKDILEEIVNRNNCYVLHSRKPSLFMQEYLSIEKRGNIGDRFCCVRPSCIHNNPGIQR